MPGRDLELHTVGEVERTERAKERKKQTFFIDWGQMDLCADVETAWSYFYLGFMEIIDRHAPLRKFRVKGRDNPWFSAELSSLLGPIWLNKGLK